MPQLEFTIWLSNAIIKWAMFTVFFLTLKSPASTFLLSSVSRVESTLDDKDNKWPWQM